MGIDIDLWCQHQFLTSSKIYNTIDFFSIILFCLLAVSIKCLHVNTPYWNIGNFGEGLSVNISMGYCVMSFNVCHKTVPTGLGKGINFPYL
jgi:hypothetical protein